VIKVEVRFRKLGSKRRKNESSDYCRNLSETVQTSLGAVCSRYRQLWLDSLVWWM